MWYFKKESHHLTLLYCIGLSVRIDYRYKIVTECETSPPIPSEVAEAIVVVSCRGYGRSWWWCAIKVAEAVLLLIGSDGRLWQTCGINH